MPQNRSRTGRFRPGVSGNPGGRPRGLARAARELLGDDGRAIVEFWLEVMQGDAAKMADRLEASRLLAQRGWGNVSHEDLLHIEELSGPDGRDEVWRTPTRERMLELARLAVELELVPDCEQPNLATAAAAARR